MSGEGRDGAPVDKAKFPGLLNEVFRSRWEFREGAPGVPERMGGHLMPSGEVAPTSTSLGQGREVFKHVFQYTEGGSPWGLQVRPAGGAGLQEGLAAEVKRCYDEAVAAKGSFVCALSGGSLVNLLGALAGQEHGMDWGKWHVLWADERLVPLDHADSNYRGAREAFLSLTSIPDAQVHAIDAALPVDQAALLYEAGMRRMGAEVLPPSAAAPSFPAIDLVLLGVGPDGHVASLFPNMPATGEAEKWVVGVQNSPKPPPERISLTLPVLNAARNVCIVAGGKGKAEVVQRAIEVQALPGSLPAQMVRPEGSLMWLLDEDSAAGLTPDTWNDPKRWPRSEIPKPPKKGKAKAKK